MFLNTREVAEKLDCCEQSVRRMVKTMGLPAIKYGKCLKFREKDLDEWIDEHAFKGTYDVSSLYDDLIRRGKYTNN